MHFSIPLHMLPNNVCIFVLKAAALVQIQILEYDPETSKVSTPEVYTHGPEVWQVIPRPADAQAIATIYNNSAALC